MTAAKWSRFRLSFLGLQQGETGVGVAPQFMSAQVGSLGVPDLAAQPEQVAEQIMPFRDHSGVHADQLGADGPRLFLCHVPLTRDLMQLHPVHPANPGEHHRAVEVRAPPLGGRGPLPSPPQVRQFPADRDHLAVQVPGDVRRNSPSLHGQHGLVEHRHRLCDRSTLKARGPLRHQGKRQQRRITRSLGCVSCHPGKVDGMREISVVECILCIELGHIPARSNAGGAFEQGAAALQPARAGGQVATQHQQEPEADRLLSRAS